MSIFKAGKINNINVSIFTRLNYTFCDPTKNPNGIFSGTRLADLKSHKECWAGWGEKKMALPC